MQYQRLDHLRVCAAVTETSTTLTRRQRLRRWADVVAREGSRPLAPLRWVEFYAADERCRLRRDDSPLALAYADPTLRAAGLAGDTLGEAQRFFELSDDQAHRLLCDCHFVGTMSGSTAAYRIRALAWPGFLGVVGRALFTPA
jgi:hypothetical protein